MIVSEIELFSLLKTKLGEQEAKALVEFVEAKLKEKDEENSKILATKADIAYVESKIADAKAELIKWMFIFWASQLLAIFSFIKFFK